MDREKEIREALYELYEMLKDVASTKGGSRLLAPELIEKLCYGKEEVRKVLETKVSTVTKESAKGTIPKKQAATQLVGRISEIKTGEEVRKLYYEEMIGYFNAATKAKVEKAFKMDELCYLYGVISPIGVKGKKKKLDLFQMFKDYYDDEARTEAMNRKLLGR